MKNAISNAAFAVVALLGVSVNAQSQSQSQSFSSEAAELRAGAREDVTPQQKYRTAIREAGGAYKEAQRDCAGMGAMERRTCLREAKSTYERDMAEARTLLRGAPAGRDANS